MAGLFGVSISPQYKGRFTFSELLLYGGFYHQHLGEGFGGLAALNNGEISSDAKPRHIRQNFEDRVRAGEFSGTDGIGYCGDSKEPFDCLSRSGEVAIVFAGNIINRKELMDYYAGRGRVFARHHNGDAETMANLIFREQEIVAGIRNATSQIEGTFAFLMLTKQGIIATVSPDNHWPMVIGEQEGAVAIASESTCFYNLGFKYQRDLKPGEIVLLKDGTVTSLGELGPQLVQICKFLWVYTAFPPASICRVSASLVRGRLGASLARADIESGFIPDIVSYVPDSGRCHGIGYHNEYCRAVNLGEIRRVPLLMEVLFKYPFTGRSYPQKTQGERDREAYLKIVPSSDRFDGLTLALLEDSVVRGTQIANSLAPKLRSMGFKQIHVRASNPELLSPCPWGKTTQPGEILALRVPDLKERAKVLGVDSLRYNSIEDLNAAVRELDPAILCIDCALRSKE